MVTGAWDGASLSVLFILSFAVFGADDTVRKLVQAPNGARWTEFPRGGRFPAMEVPGELAADLQGFFGPLA